MSLKEILSIDYNVLEICVLLYLSCLLYLIFIENVLSVCLIYINFIFFFDKQLPEISFKKFSVYRPQCIDNILCVFAYEPLALYILKLYIWFYSRLEHLCQISNESDEFCGYSHKTDRNTKSKNVSSLIIQGNKFTFKKLQLK